MFALTLSALSIRCLGSQTALSLPETDFISLRLSSNMTNYSHNTRIQHNTDQKYMHILYPMFFRACYSTRFSSVFEEQIFIVFRVIKHKYCLNVLSFSTNAEALPKRIQSNVYQYFCKTALMESYWTWQINCDSRLTLYWLGGGACDAAP